MRMALPLLPNRKKHKRRTGVARQGRAIYGAGLTQVCKVDDRGREHDMDQRIGSHSPDRTRPVSKLDMMRVNPMVNDVSKGTRVIMWSTSGLDLALLILNERPSNVIELFLLIMVSEQCSAEGHHLPSLIRARDG